MAILIGLFFVALLAVKFWANGEAVKIRGADQMKHDSQGNLYVHFGQNLYQFDSRGEFTAEIDLHELGVFNLVGDFAFFKNGDLLIRRGRYEPSFPESLFTYMRIRDLDAPVTDEADVGLARCELDSKTCEPFGNDGFDLDSAFHVAIDWQTDAVYFSDTSRHQVFKFDQYGNQLAKQDQGYFFPNQISFSDDTLWIADTNHHAIQKANASTGDFASILATYRTKNTVNQAKDWTYSFARVGDDWWVNVMETTMSHGDILIFNKQWEYQKHLALPEDADPIDIAHHAGDVWVTDFKGNKIAYFNVDGEPLNTTMPEILKDIAEQNQQTRQQYEQIGQWAMGAFVVALAFGLGVGLLQNRKSQDITQGSLTLDWSDPNIVWVPKNKKKVRQTYFLLALMGLMIFYMLFSTIGIDPDVSLLALSVFCSMIIGMAIYVIYKQFSVGIGRLGDVLVLKNNRGKYAAGKREQIVYSDTHVLIDKVFIQLNLQNSIYETQEMISEIGPLLKEARHVSRNEMQRLLLKRQNPIVVILFVVIIFGMIASVLLK